MAKIINDKYYTSLELAKYCIDKTKEIIGAENISEYLEPSAGSGSFSNILNCIAYDIEPEHDNIIKQDYLTLELEYKRGRCIIGNPPYGTKNQLSVKFFKKSVMIGDYIAFILPISQYNNNIKMYEFDLIYSEDLGKKYYSNQLIYTCFNIYKRPINGLNKELVRKNYKLKDIIMKENRPVRNQIVKDFNYDLRICSWGSIGKEVDYNGQYAKELCIQINNDKYKDKIIKLIKNTNWLEIYPMKGVPNLLQWQVYKYIKEQIPEME